MPTLSSDDVVAVALVQAIRGDDIDALRRLLDEHAELASARLRSGKGTTRTPLHVASVWLGYFPNGPAVVHLLISAGADPNAPVTGGSHAETPLPATTSTRPSRSSTAAPTSKRQARRLLGGPRWTMR
jgi:hypothetical protein